MTNTVDFEIVWRNHVAAARQRILDTRPCPHPRCSQQHWPPTVTRADLIARGVIRPKHRGQND